MSTPADRRQQALARKLAGPVRWEGLGELTRRYWLDQARTDDKSRGRGANTAAAGPSPSSTERRS